MTEPTSLISMVEASLNLTEPFTPESRWQELALTSHVVRRTGVEVPAIDLVIGGTFVEEGVGARFIEMELGGASRPGKGKAWTFHPLPYVLLQLNAPVC